MTEGIKKILKKSSLKKVHLQVEIQLTHHETEMLINKLHPDTNLRSGVTRNFGVSGELTQRLALTQIIN